MALAGMYHHSLTPAGGLWAKRNPQLRKRTTEKMASYVLHVTLLILLPSDLPAKMERNDAVDIDFQGYCTRN